MIIGSSTRVLGNGHFNLYLAGSEEKVIIEGGVSGVLPVVRRQAAGVGAGGVCRIVVMHAHFDHVCGIPGLGEIFPEAHTAGSAKAAEVLARPAVVENFFREDQAMTGTLAAISGSAVSCGNGGDRQDKPSTLPIDEIIPEGSVWDLGPGFSLQFSRAPGHSPCSLMAYCPEDEIMFSSDSAGFPVEEGMVFPIFFDGYRNYIKTIGRMLELPVTVLAGAHEEIIIGPDRVRNYLRLALDWAERTRARVEEAVGRGVDREDLARQIFSEFYRGRLKMYSTDNIMLCSRLIVKRSIEAAER